MCGACGPAPATAPWFTAGLPDDRGAHLRAREVVLAVTTRLADPRRAVVAAEPGSTAVVVRSLDGRSVRVTDLGEVWSTITAVGGQRCDPLELA